VRLIGAPIVGLETQIIVRIRIRGNYPPDILYRITSDHPDEGFLPAKVRHQVVRETIETTPVGVRRVHDMKTNALRQLVAPSNRNIRMRESTTMSMTTTPEARMSGITVVTEGHGDTDFGYFFLMSSGCYYNGPN
jgi:hypothetical protein